MISDLMSDIWYLIWYFFPERPRFAASLFSEKNSPFSVFFLGPLPRLAFLRGKTSHYLSSLFSGKKIPPLLRIVFLMKEFSRYLDSPLGEKLPTTSTRFPKERTFLLPKLAFFQERIPHCLSSLSQGKNSPSLGSPFQGKNSTLPRLTFSGKKTLPASARLFQEKKFSHYFSSPSSEEDFPPA